MNRDQLTFIPIILSGGCGTRLWPLSRQEHPKPFIKLDQNETLLRKTFLRIKALNPISELLTVTNRDYFFKSLAEYDVENDFPLSFLLEPSARNTTPSIALAVQKIIQTYDQDAILLVVPADHLIPDQKSFKAYCEKAITLADQDKIVTFGIKPSSPETGFGYIECGSKDKTMSDAYSILQFIEKPDRDHALHYLQSQRYLWNAGIFCFKAGVMQEEMAKHASELLSTAIRCIKRSKERTAFANAIEISPADFNQFEHISIDYAIMEKTKRGAVIACDMTWHDIGSWEAFKKIYPDDSNGNTIIGENILIDSSNNLIHSSKRLIGAIGINNLAIIDSEDALLIAERSRVQEVKEIVLRLKEKNHLSYTEHHTVLKPWGNFTILETGEYFQIKRILVKPHKALSLQRHQKRSEHWVVVAGKASVIRGNEQFELSVNESTFIAVGMNHRLSNNTDEELIVIEIQTGVYLGEDDILRIEDNFGRVKVDALES